DFFVFAKFFDFEKRTVSYWEEQLSPCDEFVRGIFGENFFRLRETREMDRCFAAFDLGQILPYLVGGEGEDGRDKAYESLGDLPEHGLGGAAGMARRREGVHAILE